MSDVSSGGALLAFFSAVAGLIRLATFVIQTRNDRQLRRMNEIPPSEPPPPMREDELDRRVSALERERELDDARVRIAVLEAEVEDARLIARDYARTAAALSHERERAERAEAHARTLRAELERVLRAVEGGHSRIALDEGGDTHGSNDERPTPPRGIRVRPPE